MTTNWTRRGALLGLGAAATAAHWPQPAHAAATPVGLSLETLADGTSLVTGAGGNVVVAEAGGELLLADGGADAHRRALQRLLGERYPRARLAALVNTHWHWDHTGYNAAAAAAGVPIVAHENTRLWLGAEVDCAWEGRVYPPRPVRERPNQTFFYGSKSLAWGGNGQAECLFLPQAHTDGDIAVFLPQANVLVAGDVASGGRYPVLDYASNGWLGGMAQALKALVARCDANTRIVPGSGPVLSRADLEAQRDLCFEVLQRIGNSYYKGETWEEFLASRPTKEFDAAWGDPGVFLRTAYRGAWDHVTEIRRIAR